VKSYLCFLIDKSIQIEGRAWKWIECSNWFAPRLWTTLALFTLKQVIRGVEIYSISFLSAKTTLAEVEEAVWLN
jgi:hypothetical protein